MAFQAIPDVAEFRLVLGRGADQFAINSLYVRNTVDAWPLGRLLTTEGLIFGWWQANIKPLVTSEWSLQRIEYRDLGAEFGVAGFVAHAEAGTRTPPGSVGIVACRVMIVGTPGAEPKRGAVYQAGMADADVSTNTFEPTYVAALEDAWSAYPPAVSAGLNVSNAAVIVSRFDGMQLVNQPNGEVLRRPVKRTEGISNTISDFLIRQRVSKQSRRRIKAPAYVS
jgi:hypothetical protein